MLTVMANEHGLVSIRDSLESLREDVKVIEKQVEGLIDDQYAVLDKHYSIFEDNRKKIQEIMVNISERIDQHRAEIANNTLADNLSTVNVKLITPFAQIPKKATNGSAGFDLYATERVTVHNNGKYHAIKTGVLLEIPPNYYGKISSRSGLAMRNQIVAFEGTIDSDYRGEIIVLLQNTSDSSYEVNIGDRIAQIVIIKLHLGNTFCEAAVSHKSNHGGFGSTGK